MNMGARGGDLRPAETERWRVVVAMVAIADVEASKLAEMKIDD